MKNRCKNGDFYWVDAYVTPIYDNGEITGYQSVRVIADSDKIARAEKIYREIAAPNKLLQLLQFLKSGLFGKWMFGSLLTLSAVFGLQIWIMPEMSGNIFYSLMVGLGAAAIFGSLTMRSAIKAAAWSRKFYNNPVASRVYTGTNDEIGQMLLVIHAQYAKMRTAMGRVSNSADLLNGVAEKTGQVVAQATQSMQTQQQDIESVATAINEMAATVEEVARNTVHASDVTLESSDQVQNGQIVVAETIKAINTLSSEIQQAGDVILELEKGSDTIGAVVEVIQNIAEQTNLLALNAAIEAARAGDQGRGFAVVADEVRTLATRTRNSTEEIKTIVDKLQLGARHAVSVMSKSCDQANASVEQTVKTSGALNAIAESVATIVNLNEQIATASEEQRSVAEEINRSIINVNQRSQETAEASRSTALATEELVSQVGQLRCMTRQFGE